MHYYAKMITNTVRLTYQYTADSEIAPKQVTASASANNLVIVPSGLNSISLSKNWRNNICFSHEKARKINYIEQCFQLHHYKLFSYQNYNKLRISATTHIFIKYDLHQHRFPYKQPHYIEFETPMIIHLNVPKYIHYNIFELTPQIVEIHPSKITSHHISFNTVLHLNIVYDTD